MEANPTRFARPVAKKLASQGKLVSATFDAFMKTVYPGAPKEQVDAMRVAFFAGAWEVYFLTMSALDDGDDVTGGDMAFMESWVEEIHEFQLKTMAAALVKTGEPN